MYLHLGQDYVIGYRDIVGIFDIETVSVGKATCAFFRESERRGQIVTVSEELPKSVVLCDTAHGYVTYISQLSAATLKKRLQNMTGFEQRLP